MSIALNIITNIDEKTKKYSSNMKLETYLEFLLQNFMYSKNKVVFICSVSLLDSKYIKEQLHKKLLELPVWIRPKVEKENIRKTDFESNNSLILANNIHQLKGLYYFNDPIVFFEGIKTPVNSKVNFTTLNNYMSVTNSSIPVIVK